MLKMIAEKSPENEKEPTLIEDDNEVEVKPQPPRKKPVLQHQHSAANIPDDAAATNPVPAGSALAVIRQQQRSNSANDVPVKPVRVNRKAEKKPLDEIPVSAVEEKDETNINEDEVQRTLAALEAKRQFSLQQSKKITAYLNALTEQKKKEENEKKKKEDRQKKRQYLLSQRLLKETQERKAMISEDKPSYREIYLNNNKHEMDEIQNKLSSTTSAASKKITPEMAEMIANRLKRKALLSQQEETEVKEKAQKSKPIKPKQPIKTKKDADDEDSEEENDDDEVEETQKKPKSSKSSGPPIPVMPPSSVPYRDFNDWKRKNNVPKDAKVFTMTGWYPCVKQAFLDRGWYFNSDPTSPFCHLKWTLRSIDVNQDTLQSWQLTNHYLKNVAITTKAGLFISYLFCSTLLHSCLLVSFFSFFVFLFVCFTLLLGM
jgi:hypothetical protein